MKPRTVKETIQSRVKRKLTNYPITLADQRTMMRKWGMGYAPWGTSKKP